MINKYDKNDLVQFISENKSSDEIALFYGVSGRTIRNWLSKEELETKVKNKGFDNVIKLSKESKIKREKNRLIYLSGIPKKLVICKCEICLKEYSIKESIYKKIGSRFCSAKCRYKFMFHTKPENHPRWLGGKSQENQIGRANNEYCEWRINVFKRDHFICQKCLSSGKKLNAHHIDNWSDNQDKRYLIENGITLCKECHRKIHKIYGQKTNEKHLNEFLGVKTINGWKRSNLESF